MIVFHPQDTIDWLIAKRTNVMYRPSKFINGGDPFLFRQSREKVSYFGCESVLHKIPIHGV